MKKSKPSRKGFIVSQEGPRRANGKADGNTPLNSNRITLFPGVTRQPQSAAPDLVCFSHLRWDFVYQRPQHLLSRCAADRRVFFVEEPVCGASLPQLEVHRRDDHLWVVVPHLPPGMNETEMAAAQQSLLIDDLFLEYDVNEYVLWYYTPMALAFSRHLEPLAVVYDCMDELSAFKNAPPELGEREAELFQRADLVFTGGHSLYEAKRGRHPNVYPFPSSIDAAHFRQARRAKADPPDQSSVPFPRLGYCGVIDERMDVELLGGLAEARPDWHFVMVGPVVKIDPADLPQRPNIHYLGGKNYQDLPAYLAGWDIALLPFANNQSTRFISPTKTPEYMAAGVPVVSTSIRDVVRPYGQQGLVKIADTVEEFVAAAAYLMGYEFRYEAWLRQVDEVLAYDSWDRTHARMMQMLNAIISSRYGTAGAPPPATPRQPIHRVMSSPTSGD